MSASKTPPPQPPFVIALFKLRDLQKQAAVLRQSMDFCADHCRMEDLVINKVLRYEAITQYAKRNSVSLDDAKAEVERMFDRLKDGGLSSTTADTTKQD